MCVVTGENNQNKELHQLWVPREFTREGIDKKKNIQERPIGTSSMAMWKDFLAIVLVTAGCYQVAVSQDESGE